LAQRSINGPQPTGGTAGSGLIPAVTPVNAASPGRAPLGRVLVIGAGFIGCHVAEACLGGRLPTTVLTRSPLHPADVTRLSGADLAVGDASVRSTLAEALGGVAHVFFCAGGLMPAESNLDPSLDANLALPPLIAVLEALRERPGVGLTFLSSGGTVYGEPTEVPVPESHPTEPDTSYGVMKLASEKYALMYGRLYGLPVRILRCANVYGEHQPAARGQGFIAAALDRLSRDETIVLFGDGMNVRDFVYVRDVAALMLRLAGRPGGPAVLNVGSGDGVTLLDVLTLAERVTGRVAHREMRADRGFDVRRVVLDVSALHQIDAWSPTSLEVGIRSTWKALSAARAS